MSQKSLNIRNSDKVQTKGIVKKRRRTSQDFDYNAAEQAWIDIQDTYQQLKQYIVQIDQKFHKRMDFQQCKIAYAYKGHLERVTKQLKRLKQIYDFNEQKFSSDKAITHLKKQCELFRQQAIRLHTQLQDALDQVDVYRRKSELLQRQLKKTNETLKKQIKIIKQQQGQKLKMKQKLAENNGLMSKMMNQSKVTNNQKNKIIIEQKSNIINDQNSQYKIAEYFKTPSPQTKSKLKKNRPFTTQTQMNSQTNFKKLQLNLDPHCFFNSNSVFRNQKIIAMHSTARQKINTLDSTKPKQNIKTNYSNLSNTYRHHTEDQQNDQNYNQRGQIKLFQFLLQQIQFLRGSIVQNKNQIIALPIDAKDTTSLILSDADVTALMKTFFHNLQIQVTQNSSGTRFRAKQKEKSKSLAKLSSQLMQKFKMKKMSTLQENPEKNPIRVSDRSKSSMSRLSVTGNKQKSNQHKFKRMEQVFSKKKIAKQHRLGKYMNNSMLNFK